MQSRFGDRRLDKRLVQLTEEISHTPSVHLPQLLTKWASLKAGYRFLNNERVSHKGLVENEQAATVKRISESGGEVILAVQDTTSFNFAKRKGLSGLGVLDDNKTPGFFAHSTLAVSEQGVPLGLLDQQVWSRKPSPAGTPDTHRAKPITHKESMKWLRGLQSLPTLDQPIVTVCDREGDIYEVLQEAHNNHMDYIIRSAWNRGVDDAPLLRDYLAEVPVVAIYTVPVQRQVDQAQRDAQVGIRYTSLTLHPPVNRPPSARVMPLEPLTVQVVVVREMAPPPEVIEPIDWVLLTTLPIHDLAQAYRVVRFYTYRWLVERFHFVLKTGGCHFEDSQLRSVEALHRLLGVCSTVAWRLLWLTYQARLTPDAPCTLALSRLEWQALCAFTRQSSLPPPAPPTLRQAVRDIAKLGGFIGRTADGEPGVKTLWRGWQRLQDIVATWALFDPPPLVGND